LHGGIVSLCPPNYRLAALLAESREWTDRVAIYASARIVSFLYVRCRIKDSGSGRVKDHPMPRKPPNNGSWHRTRATAWLWRRKYEDCEIDESIREESGHHVLHPGRAASKSGLPRIPLLELRTRPCCDKHRREPYNEDSNMKEPRVVTERPCSSKQRCYVG
jgi:hypothetical protein